MPKYACISRRYLVRITTPRRMTEDVRQLGLVKTKAVVSVSAAIYQPIIFLLTALLSPTLKYRTGICPVYLIGLL